MIDLIDGQGSVVQKKKNHTLKKLKNRQNFTFEILNTPQHFWTSILPTLLSRRFRFLKNASIFFHSDRFHFRYLGAVGFYQYLLNKKNTIVKKGKISKFFFKNLRRPSTRICNIVC